MESGREALEGTLMLHTRGWPSAHSPSHAFPGVGWGREAS